MVQNNCDVTLENKESYYSDGQIRSKGTIKNGKREGIWKWFHQDGSLWTIENYSNGQLDGEWKQYDKSGNLELKQVFDKGELLNVDELQS